MAQSTRQETEAERRARAQTEEQQTREAAEAATAHLPQPGQPPSGPMSPVEARPDEPTVLMQIPEGGITLTLPGYTMVYFPAGIQPVPQSLAEDEYLAQSGATPVREGRR